MICFIKMRKHLAKKQSLNALNTDTVTTTGVDLRKNKSESGKIRERIYQKNVTRMTITLVSISTLVRITTLACGVYWLFQFDLIAAILGVSADTTIALNSTLSFFVYIRFNKKYRKIFLDLVLRHTDNGRLEH